MAIKHCASKAEVIATCTTNQWFTTDSLYLIY